MGLWNNKQLLSKAAITSSTSNFTSGFGLSQEEANRFIDYLIDESRLKNKVRIERFNDYTKKINKLFLDDEEVVAPGVAATDPGETVGVNTSQIALTGKEGVAIVQISDDALEDNVEGDAFADHLMKMIAKAAANQIVRTLLLGVKESTSVTKFIQSWDGWYARAIAGGTTVNAAGFADRYIDRTKMSALVKGMPNKYFEAGMDFAFIGARHVAQDWRDEFADRETAAGDAAATGLNAPPYAGIPFDLYNTVPTSQPVLVTGGDAVSTTVSGDEAAAQTTITLASGTGLNIGDYVVFDYEGSRQETRQITNIAGADITVAATTYAHPNGTTVKKCTVDGSFVLLTAYQNLIWGIQRDIKIEFDRRPRLRATDWVLHFRMDAQVENPEMCAVLKNLKTRPAA